MKIIKLSEMRDSWSPTCKRIWFHEPFVLVVDTNTVSQIDVKHVNAIYDLNGNSIKTNSKLSTKAAVIIPNKEPV